METNYVITGVLDIEDVILELENIEEVDEIE